jgi:uncharacterized iron-regulated protein
MILAPLFLAVAISQTAPDPDRLRIGQPGEITIAPGTIVDMHTGQKVEISAIVDAAAGKPFVFLGESHTNPEHHKFQAKVIDALAKVRPVVVGFEMFTRPVQEDLDPWTLGWWNEDEFVAESDWKHQWGYDFSLYRPIFQTIQDHALPMVALNIPRAWVHSVGTKGYGGLSADQKSQLPADLGALNPTHRTVFNAMIGGHPGTGAQIDNMYAAQVLWDQAMADSAIKYLAAHPQPSDSVFVVVAGSGHVMYGQGINYRLSKRTGQSGVTVVMVDGDKPVTVSRGLGDFVYVGGVEQKQ